jgi:hypothetical protein
MNNKLEAISQVGKKVVRAGVAVGLAGAIPFGVTNIKDVSWLPIDGTQKLVVYVRDPVMPVALLPKKSELLGVLQ